MELHVWKVYFVSHSGKLPFCQAPVDIAPICFYCRILLSIRETGGDWADGQHGRGDPILKGEKDPKAGPHIKIPGRDVGPSSTQV